MLRRTLLAFLAAAVVLAPAPAALAGSGPSAGDNQYVDPLSGTQTSGSSSSSGSHPSTSSSSPPPASQPAPTPAPSAPATTAAGPTPAAAAPSPAAGDPRGALPYTGVDTGLIALMGAGLAGGGVLLRLRVARR